MDGRPIVWIALAFVVGAILPAVGVIAGAAAVGYWYASARHPHDRIATRETLDIIEDVERRERKRLK